MKIVRSLLLLPFYLVAALLQAHPFNYDLHLQKIPGNQNTTMICFHGMGGNYRIGDYVKEVAELDYDIISFNFPDHDIRKGFDPEKTVYGTIHELLPALYVLKTSVIDEQKEDIILYGFSAGGGALINMIAALADTRFDEALLLVGIGALEKRQLLDVIQKGLIILDTPLKSIREIIADRGPLPELMTVGNRYQSNDMEPIDALERLNSLSLHCIVHFQQPDEVLSNRDDELYIERIKHSNQSGQTHVLIGKEEGHSFPHSSLWNYYLTSFESKK